MDLRDSYEMTSDTSSNGSSLTHFSDWENMSLWDLHGRRGSRMSVLTTETYHYHDKKDRNAANDLFLRFASHTLHRKYCTKKNHDTSEETEQEIIGIEIIDETRRRREALTSDDNNLVLHSCHQNICLCIEWYFICWISLPSQFFSWEEGETKNER